MAVIKLKNGKAQGPDNIVSEFVVNCGPVILNWLWDFYTECMTSKRIPKIWWQADIIAILKPNKPAHEAKSYWLISPLCMPLELLECLLLSPLDPVIDPQLLPEQAGFRQG